MTAFYHLTLHSSYNGQSILNNFYYVVGVDVPGGLPGITHALGIAESFRDGVVQDALGVDPSPYLRDIMPDSFTFDKITCAPINDLFQWEYDAPAELLLNFAGARTDADFTPAEVYFKVGFQLEPYSFLEGANPLHKPPVKAHVKIGPIALEAMLDDGTLSETYLADYAGVADKMASNLAGIGTSAIYYPVRATTRRLDVPVIGYTVYRTYTNPRGVSGAVVRNRSFWLRTRNSNDQ